MILNNVANNSFTIVIFNDSEIFNTVYHPCLLVSVIKFISVFRS